MRKLILTTFLGLGVFLSFGQKHDFVMQVMPQFGNFTQCTDYRCESYQPLLTASIGLQGRSNFNLFYQVFASAQLARKDYVNNYNPIVYPNLMLSVGYGLNQSNALFAQASLWSYSLAYQRDWNHFSIGLSAGKMFGTISNQLNIGPWMKWDGETRRPNLQDSGLTLTQRIYNTNILLAAYVNVNLFSVHGLGSKQPSSPTEF
jgi:hypothetical protein